MECTRDPDGCLAATVLAPGLQAADTITPSPGCPLRRRGTSSRSAGRRASSGSTRKGRCGRCSTLANRTAASRHGSSPTMRAPAPWQAMYRIDRNLPAVVLVHGGGGTAFSEWAELWAKRGYAAIAMDLAGHRPVEGKNPHDARNRTRLDDGGPNQGDDEKFGSVDKPPGEQWPYHAVANTILAHSLIRSFKGVDGQRTAVTGISWGGYLTCIVAGVDNRFKAAVPVYGCGFLHENSAWLARFAKMKPDQRDRWVQSVGSVALPAGDIDADPVRQRHQRLCLSAGQLHEEFRLGARPEATVCHGKHAARPPGRLGSERDRAVRGSAPPRDRAAAGARRVDGQRRQGIAPMERPLKVTTGENALHDRHDGDQQAEVDIDPGDDRRAKTSSPRLRPTTPLRGSSRFRMNGAPSSAVA